MITKYISTAIYPQTDQYSWVLVFEASANDPTIFHAYYHYDIVTADEDTVYLPFALDGDIATRIEKYGSPVGVAINIAPGNYLLIEFPKRKNGLFADLLEGASDDED